MEEIEKLLLNKIKAKKELSGISDSLVSELITKYLEKINSPTDLSPNDFKIIVKEIRADLVSLAGRFQTKVKERKSLIEKSDFASLLRTHLSTREREGFYGQLNDIISKLNVSSIIDLGSGINPLAITVKYKKYYAIDINESDLSLVDSYFKSKNLPGETFSLDLRKPDIQLPRADLALILKFFDTIETRGHKLAERIINNLHSDYLIISFSTKTLSGKPMNHPQRGWIERLLSRLGYEFEIFKNSNEIYYLAKKLCSRSS